MAKKLSTHKIMLTLMDQHRSDRVCAAHEHVWSVCLRSFVLFTLVCRDNLVWCQPVRAQGCTRFNTQNVQHKLNFFKAGNRPFTNWRESWFVRKKTNCKSSQICHYTMHKFDQILNLWFVIKICEKTVID